MIREGKRIKEQKKTKKKKESRGRRNKHKDRFKNKFLTFSFFFLRSFFFFFFLLLLLLLVVAFEECLTDAFPFWKMSCWPVRFYFIFLNSALVFFFPLFDTHTHTEKNWKGKIEEEGQCRDNEKIENPHVSAHMFHLFVTFHPPPLSEKREKKKETWFIPSTRCVNFFFFSSKSFSPVFFFFFFFFFESMFFYYFFLLLLLLLHKYKKNISHKFNLCCRQSAQDSSGIFHFERNRNLKSKFKYPTI